MKVLMQLLALFAVASSFMVAPSTTTRASRTGLFMSAEEAKKTGTVKW